jgi:hypothetical protein
LGKNTLVFGVLLFFISIFIVMICSKIVETPAFNLLFQIIKNIKILINLLGLVKTSTEAKILALVGLK